MLKLLKLGLPWDYIQTLSESQLYMILGVEAAVEEKHSEDADADLNRNMSSANLGMGGF